MELADTMDLKSIDLKSRSSSNLEARTIIMNIPIDKCNHQWKVLISMYSNSKLLEYCEKCYDVKLEKEKTNE